MYDVNDLNDPNDLSNLFYEMTGTRQHHALPILNQPVLVSSPSTPGSTPSSPSSPSSQQPTLLGGDSHGSASSRGSHRLGSCLTCHKQWALRYWYRIVPLKEKPWTHAGTMRHQVLAHHSAEKMAVKPAWSTEESLEKSLERLAAPQGNPEDVRVSMEFAEWYAYATAGEAVKPYCVEMEFRARLGDIDPDGKDEPEISWQSDDGLRTFFAPRLNDEVVTCRVDVIMEENALLWIWDHKSKSNDWKNGGGLPPWKEDGEYSMNWQVMMNLHIVRHNLGVDCVAGFKIHRITRQHPFKHDLHTLTIPTRAYLDAPKTAREAVRQERTVGLLLAQGGRATANYSVCFAKYGESDYLSACDYVNLCRANSEADLRDRLKSDFKKLS